MTPDELESGRERGAMKRQGYKPLDQEWDAFLERDRRRPTVVDVCSDLRVSSDGTWSGAGRHRDVAAVLKDLEAAKTRARSRLMEIDAAISWLTKGARR